MASGISAIGRENRQRIVVVDVAQIAGHVGVAIGQQETCRAVIEKSRRPGRNRVARRASRSRDREPSRHVVWNIPANRCGAQERCLVAAITVHRTQSVVIVHMTGNASRRRRGHMRPSQGKTGGAVIEHCRRPIHRRVACRAVYCRERRSGCGVNWSNRSLPGGQMALRISAIGWRNLQRVVVVDVAGSAGRRDVGASERETDQAVIES